MQGTSTLWALRNRFGTRISSAAVLLLFPSGSPLAGVVRLKPEIRASIQKAVAAAATRGFSGALALRVNGEAPFFAVAGSADGAGRVPVTPSTLFQVASISKYFTAVATLKLVEEGKISLDDPIGKFLPELPADHAAILVKELLPHTSGLANAYAAEGIGDRAKAIAALGRVPVDRTKRGEFGYTHDGYELLAMIVEIVSGVPYEKFVHRELLDKARISGIRYWSEVDLADPHQVAQCLRPMAAKLARRNYGTLGSSAVVSTADALADWQLAVWAGKVLPPSLRDQLFTERVPTSIGAAGYGVFLAHDGERGRRLLARGYEDWGANAVLSHWPEAGVVLAVVTSSGPAESTGHPGWSRELTDTVAGIIFGSQPGSRNE
jgi:CubicO group peptidase (beta-lactamase class C family)